MPQLLTKKQQTKQKHPQGADCQKADAGGKGGGGGGRGGGGGGEAPWKN